MASIGSMADGPHLTLAVDVQGARRKFEVLGDASVWRHGLLKWRKRKQKELSEIFRSGGNWPALAASTLHHKGSKAEAQKAETRKSWVVKQLTRKLQRDRKRAIRRAASTGIRGAAAVLRRREALRILNSMLGVAEAQHSLLGAEQQYKLAKSVHKRLARGIAAVDQRTQVLGRIAGSIKSKLEGLVLEIFSEIAWAGAHNDGGVVGHGATLPERRFLEITEDDVAFLVEDLVEAGANVWSLS